MLAGALPGRPCDAPGELGTPCDEKEEGYDALSSRCEEVRRTSLLV